MIANHSSDKKNCIFVTWIKKIGKMKKKVILRTIVLVFVCLACCHLCLGQETTTAKWKPCTPKKG
jgi:hypothetical protein